jgi:SET domain-containing protein
MSYFEIRKASDIKGLGAFATQDIPACTILDEAQVLVMKQKDWIQIQDTVLYNYSFEWNDPDESDDDDWEVAAFAMSPCEFINHSYTPNSKYIIDKEKRVITFSTIRDIASGEELTVNYNGTVDDCKPVWFDVEE